MRHAYRNITDAQIRAAQPFEGWSADYWIPAHGTPSGSPQWKHLQNDAHHAYHIQYLAGIMHQLGHWIGGPPVLLGDTFKDGSHRIRAVEYLRPQVEITIPPAIPYSEWELRQTA